MRGRISSLTVTAYGIRYYAPRINGLLSFTHVPRLLHRHRHGRSGRFPTLTSSSSPPPSGDLYNLLAGNCPFSKMEVVLTFYVMLIVSHAVSCTLVGDDLQQSACPGIVDLNSLPIVSPPVEAMRPMLSSSKLRSKQFWTGGGSSRNKAMVENLQRYGVITSKRVAEVMEALDRGLFVPDGSPAYVDSPMPIGYNATISAPHMHATCLQLLEKNLQPGMRALDIGSGTGYLTACFALMVGPEGRAVGVEHIPELVELSIKNIEKSAAAPLLKEGSLSVHVGDGRQGWPEFGAYDAIHVGAASPDIPQALLNQLKPGGRMVIPVGNFFQDLKVVDRKLDGSISVHSETSVRYVPLTSRDEQLRGY